MQCVNFDFSFLKNPLIFVRNKSVHSLSIAPIIFMSCEILVAIQMTKVINTINAMYTHCLAINAFSPFFLVGNGGGCGGGKIKTNKGKVWSLFNLSWCCCCSQLLLYENFPSPKISSFRLMLFGSICVSRRATTMFFLRYYTQAHLKFHWTQNACLPTHHAHILHRFLYTKHNAVHNVPHLAHVVTAQISIWLPLAHVFGPVSVSVGRSVGWWWAVRVYVNVSVNVCICMSVNGILRRFVYRTPNRKDTVLFAYSSEPVQLTLVQKTFNQIKVFWPVHCIAALYFVSHSKRLSIVFVASKLTVFNKAFQVLLQVSFPRYILTLKIKLFWK